MKLLTSLLGALLPLTALTTASPSTPETSQPPASIITLRIPATAVLPNPNTLPPSTHATLSTKGSAQLTAWLSTSNTFVFRDLPRNASYLVDIYCFTHAFSPLRLDVDSHGNLQVWETYRGNDWANKGEAVRPSSSPESESATYDVRVLGTKGYFIERAKFNFFSILRNPMVLLGLVSMGIFIGMPYLVDNMDPEMRAEWEERQKTNPMNGIMGAATGTGGGGGSNFDMAAFLAGSKPTTAHQREDTSAVASGSENTPSGGKGGGGKNGKRR